MSSNDNSKCPACGAEGPEKSILPMLSAQSHTIVCSACGKEFPKDEYFSFNEIKTK
jgi:predicted RNA-binding Zn-ribbon protein involved in translation (DUF1610 family)